MDKIDVVKLQARTTKSKEYVQYLLTVPKSMIEELGWRKGQPLIVRIMEIEINNSRKKALVYHEP